MEPREALTRIRARAEDMVAGRLDPRTVAYDIWDLAMKGAAQPGPPSSTRDHCHALWLTWGSLTDAIEMRPDEKAEAEETMLHAAGEWLRAADDERAWRHYFEHWLYTELGYKRP